MRGEGAAPSEGSCWFRSFISGKLYYEHTQETRGMAGKTACSLRGARGKGSICPKIDKYIKEIEYDREIGLAISDYWKATMTIAKYFKDDLMYCESLDEYVEDLSTKLHFAKSNSEIDANGVEDKEKLKISQKLYNAVMQWEAKDFGSIIRNQGYFQRGVIHDIVDDKELRWKVGVDDEHQ